MANYKKSLILVKEHLDNGETIHSSIYGTYEIKLMGKDSIRNGIFIATENRIVFYAKKLFGYDLESFPFKNISSIEKSKGLMGHSISFFASGNNAKMKWINSGDINSFAEYVNSKIGKSEPVKNVINQSEKGIPELIQQLSELKEKGILSEEEFKTKKAELLSKI
ncbi:PH domain-containing protein [Polaribacter sp. MSW13]|uniref:PH domain-containing protein n=1 Tax=Polaribacter marinus TaxID=2916838 RepID=A0A9X1VT97_9FLAO|nr:PH domain-containing protein [Polaribacter marinus]MCI2230440.1 PH domain-containing protein [Polaribacter marinus]